MSDIRSWGAHYLRSLSRAHLAQVCNNFKAQHDATMMGVTWNIIESHGLTLSSCIHKTAGYNMKIHETSHGYTFGHIMLYPAVSSWWFGNFPVLTVVSAPGSRGPALWWQLVSRGKKGKWWDGAPNFWPSLNFRLEFGGTKFWDPNWTVQTHQTHLKTLTLVFELPLWLSDLGQNVGSAEFGSALLVEAGSTTTWFCTVLLISPHFGCEDAFFLIAHIDIKSELVVLSLNRLV
jgi:hypothetical protein